MINTKIAERYLIQAELGAGGMGIVYRGTDLQTGQPVAIKHLKAQLAQPEMIERFKREGEALRTLNHPNIVKMLDAVEEASNYYLVMELLPGGDLNTLLQHGRMAQQQVLQIALDIADALTRTHRLNIIHRDLKPANVLIASDGTPRLSDFGIAHLAQRERVTETDTIIGTLDYLAPEALNGQTVDPRSDIWAFGVMLFEMLAGQRPFQGMGYGEIIHAITTAPVPDLEALCPDASIALIDLIYRMLEKDQNARIPSMRHLGASLEDILHGRDTTAPSPTRFEIPTTDLISRPQHNLPTSTTPFVGREQELAELDRLIRDRNSRMIAVLAPGGMGKTRLALEAGKQAIGQFTNSVYFVDLAPLTNPDRIVSALAEAVDYQFQPGSDQKQQILTYLADRQMLLIFDNFEHLLGGASLVTEILRAAPQVEVLVTSRQRLNQTGETLFHLSGMAFPDWETQEDALTYAAVKLFMQGARRVQPDFELTIENMDYVARICKLVQGMPLGILLAASWLEMLTVEEIAAEIAKDVDFLSSELSDLPERQHSIRAVFDYSWRLMTAAEQQVFMKLSLFRGGFTREAAQAAAGASLRELMSLVNKSLIQRDSDSGRFNVHELLRQYAEQKLGESAVGEATWTAYLDYFTTYLQERYDDLQGRRQLAATEEIQAEANNIRLAWQVVVDRRDTTHLAIMADTWALRASQGTDIVGDSLMLKQAVDTLEPATPAWDRVACMYEYVSAVLSTLTPEYRFSEQVSQRARQTNNHKLLVLSLLTRGMAGMYAGEPSAFALLQEGIALATEPDDTFYRLRMGMFPMGLGLVLAGQPEAGYEQMKAAVDECEQIGDYVGLAIMASDPLPLAAIALNRLHEVLPYVERAIGAVKSASDRTFFRWVKSYFEAYLVHRQD